MTALIVRLVIHDERALHALVSRRRRWLDLAMRALTRLGDPPVAIASVLALLLAGPPALHAAGVRAAFALAVSHALVQLLKRTVVRPRPRLPAGIRALVHAPDRFSFPSGHAAATLSIALPLAASLAPALAAGFLLLALLVGISRSYLGVHYPGDVVAGWGLAAAGALLGAILLG